LKFLFYNGWGKRHERHTLSGGGRRVCQIVAIRGEKGGQNETLRKSAKDFSVH
jgi:hypothetical protein